MGNVFGSPEAVAILERDRRLAADKAAEEKEREEMEEATK